MNVLRHIHSPKTLHLLSLKNHRWITSSTVLRSSTVQVTVDGKTVDVPEGVPLIQACDAAGVEIPRFCYHERLSIAGNCRMCLVEVEKSAKPVVSCAMPVANGMKVFTTTPMVKKAREGVMEFLLANHPLDCPICDQGGECDLQDQSMVYGSDRSRFQEFVGKRAVEDKNFGPLVKTQMNRCIHCTRCVRFANEVAGLEDLGTTGRGADMQIGTYIEKILDSEMSGNIIDLCPVGALTSKPYAFKARPWELTSTETIDVHDALGSHIRVDTRGIEVLRVLPRECPSLNEEWIADKTRYACDGLRRQRLTVPMIKSNGHFVPCTWEEAFTTIADRLATVSPHDMVAVAGPLADVESMVALRDLFHRLNATQLTYEGSATLPAYGMNLRSAYILNKTLADIEHCDAILLVGTHPRHEAPLLNARLRKAYLRGASIALIGPKVDANYDYEHLGEGLDALCRLTSESSSMPFLNLLKQAQSPLLLVGEHLSQHPQSKRIFSEVARLGQQVPALSSAYGVLQRQASRVGALDIGFASSAANMATAKFVYLLGAEEAQLAVSKDAFVVYQGHHGDAGAEMADVILPGAAYTEKTATYVNLEGRVQRTLKAVHPPGLARNDWTIVRALADVLKVPLPFSTLAELQARMSEIAPHLVNEAVHGTVPPTSSFASLALNALYKADRTAVKATPFELPISDYYRTDSISRASPTMAKCTAAFTKK